MDCIVHGVTKSQTRLSDFHFTSLKGFELDIWASLVAQMVKNLPAMQETQIQSLDGEDPQMATHSSIPAWKISWTVTGRL